MEGGPAQKSSRPPMKKGESTDTAHGHASSGSTSSSISTSSSHHPTTGVGTVAWARWETCALAWFLTIVVYVVVFEPEDLVRLSQLSMCVYATCASAGLERMSPTCDSSSTIAALAADTLRSTR